MRMSGPVITNKTEGYWEAQRGSFVVELERDPNYDTLGEQGQQGRSINVSLIVSYRPLLLNPGPRVKAITSEIN